MIVGWTVAKGESVEWLRNIILAMASSVEIVILN